MIIIQLKGGLGNQLFQYACGRALMLRQKAIGHDSQQLGLDITGYNRDNGADTPRKYSLNFFNIHADLATPLQIQRLKYPYGIISKVLRFIWIKVLRQGNPPFRKYIFYTERNVYLDGFFQTEKYFIDFETEIRRDLTLRNPLNAQARNISDTIRNTPRSISLHVRRGDYVSDTKTNEHHGTCGAEYYTDALEYLTSRIDSSLSLNDLSPGHQDSSLVHIFVFSDDIEWVKTNMPLKYPATYVSSPEIPDYEELILMSECKHNIIANSSFSWWGAWLNENPSKIVIAPKRWIKGNDIDYKDICPTSWIRI